MKSVKCPECGFVGWADAERCKKCGVIRLADPSEDSHQPAQGYRDYQPSYQNYSDGELKKGLATTSLVLGIVGFFTFGVLGVGAITGLILAIMAMNKAKRSPDEYGGGGMAIAGLVTNIICLTMMAPILIIAAIAVPNLLAARRAANEGASIATLRSILSAEATYQATRGNGSYATLDQLSSEGLIDAQLSTGQHFGYKFTVDTKLRNDDGLAGFQALAVPIEYGNTGIRSFFVDETGVIRGENSRGAEATDLSPPLDDDSLPRVRPQRVSSYSDRN